LKKKPRNLLILIVLLIALGGILLVNRVYLLELENTSHPRAVRVRIEPTETFVVFYVDSVTNESVVEELKAERDGIILMGVKTKGQAIKEYYGFENFKEFHPVNLKLGAIFFRVGVGEGQGLVVRDRKIYMSEVGAQGDRIRLRVQSVSRGRYLLSQLF